MTPSQQLEALAARISALELDIECLRAGTWTRRKHRAVQDLRTAIAGYQQQIDALIESIDGPLSASDEQYERQAGRDRLDGFARTKGKDWT